MLKVNNIKLIDSMKTVIDLNFCNIIYNITYTNDYKERLYITIQETRI